MNLVNHEPLKSMSRLQNEINQFFRTNEWLPTHHDDGGVATNQWLPTVDIKDENDCFVISADIPGVDPKEIDVSMENGMLTIKGERKTEDKDESNGYRRIECSYGSFYRRFSLPDNADSGNIKAKGKDGVLEITVAKKEPSKAKRIKVSS